MLHSSLDDLVFFINLSVSRVLKIYPEPSGHFVYYVLITWGRCDTLVASPSLAPTQRESSPRDQPAIADWGIEDPRTTSWKIFFNFPSSEKSHNFTIITDRRIEDPRTTSEKYHSSIFPLHIISPSLQTGELKEQNPVLRENWLFKGDALVVDV